MTIMKLCSWHVALQLLLALAALVATASCSRVVQLVPEQHLEASTACAATLRQLQQFRRSFELAAKTPDTPQPAATPPPPAPTQKQQESKAAPAQAPAQQAEVKVQRPEDKLTTPTPGHPTPPFKTPPPDDTKGSSSGSGGKSQSPPPSPPASKSPPSPPSPPPSPAKQPPAADKPSPPGSGGSSSGGNASPPAPPPAPTAVPSAPLPPSSSAGAPAGPSCAAGRSLRLYAASRTRMCVLEKATANEGMLWNAVGQQVSYTQALKCYVASCPPGLKPDIPGTTPQGIVTAKAAQAAGAGSSSSSSGGSSGVQQGPTIITVEPVQQEAGPGQGRRRLLEQQQDVFTVLNFAASCFTVCE